MIRNVSEHFRYVRELVAMLLALIADAVRYLGLCLRPSPALAAENLFLRKQLALYQEHQVKPRRAANAIRLAMVWLLPVANSICERVFGSLRRESLDVMIPLNERHLYGILKEWVGHYNQGEPHMSLEPGLPKSIRALPVQRQAHRHRLPAGQRVAAQPVVGSLHHEYELEQWAA